MFELVSTTSRSDKTIQVYLHGFLRNSGWEASVTGIYPGNMEHSTDTGRAEVYIDEYEPFGSIASLGPSIPWSASVSIHDTEHNEVGIFVNRVLAQIIPVTRTPVRFEVYAYVGSDRWGSIILPVGHSMGRLFHCVFGPTSHEECTKWVAEHAQIDFY